ncbi:MAG: hypothetical protein EOO43_06400 [Flavobacterium sp.]|nr:MAG: hypothetical protein EOO43_06400 [Flavobacterium sp.]
MTDILKLLTLKRHYESFPWWNALTNQKNTLDSEQRRIAYYEAVAAIKEGGQNNRYHVYIKKALRKNSEHINIKKMFYSAKSPISSYLDPTDLLTDRDYLRVVQHSLFVLNRDTLVDLKSVRLAKVIP